MLSTPSLAGPFPFPVARDSVTQNAGLTIAGVNIDTLGVLVPSLAGTESLADAQDAAGQIVASVASAVVVATAETEAGTLVPVIASVIAVAGQDFAAGILAPSVSAVDVVAISEVASGTLVPTITASDVVGVSEVESPGDTGGVIGAIALGSLHPAAIAATVRPIAVDSAGLLSPIVTASELTLAVVNEDMAGSFAPTMSADASITNADLTSAQLSYGSDGVFELHQKQKGAPKPLLKPQSIPSRIAIAAGQLSLVGVATAGRSADRRFAGQLSISGGAMMRTDLSETEILHIALAAA